jgi:hypothetical protein
MSLVKLRTENEKRDLRVAGPGKRMLAELTTPASAEPCGKNELGSNFENLAGELQEFDT